jgi:hypothetical protein
MTRSVRLRHEFVEFIPNRLDDGVLYISWVYATVSHNCCCGCGTEVVTPLAPSEWSLTFDGVTVSLAPSVGNWSLPCQSHYWIRRNNVVWARRWYREEIEAGRDYDHADQEQPHVPSGGKPEEPPSGSERSTTAAPARPAAWSTSIWRWFVRRARS